MEPLAHILEQALSTEAQAPIGMMSPTACKPFAGPAPGDPGKSKTACSRGQCFQGIIRTERGEFATCPQWEKVLWASSCPIRREEWAKELARAGVGPRYHGCTPGRVIAANSPAHLKAQIERIEAYRSLLPQNLREGFGLILEGPVGTMKTSAAVSILLEALEKGYGGYFIVSAALLDQIFTLKTANPEEWVAFERRLKEIPLLVWDDLGAEHAEGWVRTKIDAIVAERYNHKRSTILTTNLKTDELKGRYAERIIDRLRETCQVITFKGTSLRRSPQQN